MELINDKCNYFTKISLNKWKKSFDLTKSKEIKIMNKLDDIVKKSVFNKREIINIYLPLIKLIIFNIKNENKKTSEYKKKINDVYIIGCNSSVSGGKSTTAELLGNLLQIIYNKKDVKVISTDSFIYPNKILIKKNIMQFKGFPISYNWNLIMKMISFVKKNKTIKIPIYDQLIGDISDKKDKINKNIKILIIEGINILNIKKLNMKLDSKFIYKNILSDYLDFSIYIDTTEENLISFFLNRLRKKKQIMAPKFKNMPIRKFEKYAIDNWWYGINHINLIKYILPYKCRSNLILTKNKNHKIIRIDYRI